MEAFQELDLSSVQNRHLKCIEKCGDNYCSVHQDLLNRDL